MNAKEATRLCQKLGALFQPLNQDQAKLATKEFLAYSVDVVEHAIEEHRRSGGTREGFIDWKQLYEGCRAADAGESNAPRQVPTPSLADVIRGQWPQVRERGDREVLLRYWRGDWRRYDAAHQERRGGLDGQQAKLPPEAYADAAARMDQQRAGYWAKCLAGAVNSLVSAGMETEGAEIAGGSIGDVPEVFRRVLEDLRANPQAAAERVPELAF